MDIIRYSLFPLFPFLNLPISPFRQFSKQADQMCPDILAFQVFPCIAWTGRLSYIHLKYLETRSTTGALKCLETNCYLSSSIISIKSTYSPSNSFMDLFIASLRFEALMISSFDLFTSLRLSR